MTWRHKIKATFPGGQTKEVIPFVLPDSYESIDDFVKMEPIPKFDNGEKAGKRGDVLHLVRRLNLDFWSSVWHNGLRTSQVMAYCLVT